jgi:elongation factor P
MALITQPAKDMYLRIDGKIWYVMDRQLKTQGRQGGLIILRMRNLETGAVLTQTIKAGVKVEQIEPEIKDVQYLYSDGSNAYFMDMETFETLPVPLGVLEGYTQFIKEGEKTKMMVHEGKTLDIKKKLSVSLLVTEAADAVKGNTANSATKEVTTETGYKINVPMFVNKGDVINVNTESGQYTGRSSE